VRTQSVDHKSVAVGEYDAGRGEETCDKRRQMWV
jgi:hypothetical protein